MENNINWQFVKSMDDLIGKLAYEDMLVAQPNRRKPTSRIKPYRLSENTLYVLETKNNYLNGVITEEEAKTIILKQKLYGKAI